MGDAWVEHLPWLYALGATLAGLEVLRRLHRAEAMIRFLQQECDRISLSLDLAQVVGQMGSWQFARSQDSVFWSAEVFAIHARDPLRGQPPLAEAIAYYHPEDRAKVAEAVQRALDVGEDFDFHARLITDEGVLKDVMVRSTCRYDRDGKTLGVMGFIIDLGPAR